MKTLVAAILLIGLSGCAHKHKHHHGEGAAACGCEKSEKACECGGKDEKKAEKKNCDCGSKT